LYNKSNGTLQCTKIDANDTLNKNKNQKKQIIEKIQHLVFVSIEIFDLS